MKMKMKMNALYNKDLIKTLLEIKSHHISVQGRDFPAHITE